LEIAQIIIEDVFGEVDSKKNSNIELKPN